jgi:hypothetical protein
MAKNKLHGQKSRNAFHIVSLPLHPRQKNSFKARSKEKAGQGVVSTSVIQAPGEAE